MMVPVLPSQSLTISNTSIDRRNTTGATTTGSTTTGSTTSPISPTVDIPIPSTNMTPPQHEDLSNLPGPSRSLGGTIDKGIPSKSDSPTNDKQDKFTNETGKSMTKPIDPINADIDKLLHYVPTTQAHSHQDSSSFTYNDIQMNAIVHELMANNSITYPLEVDATDVDNQSIDSSTGSTISSVNSSLDLHSFDSLSSLSSHTLFNSSTANPPTPPNTLFSNSSASYSMRYPSCSKANTTPSASVNSSTTTVNLSTDPSSSLSIPWSSITLPISPSSAHINNLQSKPDNNNISSPIVSQDLQYVNHDTNDITVGDEVGLFEFETFND